ncbi:dehydrodolichyl diphosphate synthase 2-like [Punica granatum]|uniref:Alkyl transferase n=2 Tax=Punica granatum TaxID=22663 RepID=A0A218XPR9_PUNGR|nr:dehydrodolichyl diphosphate synthase 2-like [Punica granatum]OWM86924.1 hypothetical protein CDL15_Pgr015960 [Punica granatum]PKI38403.1 hypothetical protein CRG98_041183 [Punica granatum]
MLSLRATISVADKPISLNQSPCLSTKTQTLSLLSLSQSIQRRALVSATDGAKDFEVVNGRMASAGGLTRVEVDLLPSGLRQELMPRHVAVCADGCGRWAHKRGLPPSAGHAAGVRSLKEMIDLSGKWGIKVLTVFLFSTENWFRPKAEVDFYMDLYERVVEHELMSACSGDGVRLSMIGDASRLPKSFQEVWAKAEQSTKNNSGLHLILAMSYGGKYDITQACKSIAHKVEDGLITLEDIDEKLVGQEISTGRAEFPCVDLWMRTSGELRISNFLLWELAYAELYFSPVLWPDFGKAEFVEALHSYQQRQRRFGDRVSS